MSLSSKFRSSIHSPNPLTIALPHQCACCFIPTELAGQLCHACFGKFDFISDPACDRCGVPLGGQMPACTTSVCANCVLSPPFYDHARASFQYNSQSRALVLSFKYADCQELANTLAMRMVVAGKGVLDSAEMLVPVPLHRLRLLRRRYNQAAVLSEALSRACNIPACSDALIRRRFGDSLGHKSPEERSLTVQGAFGVNPKYSALLKGVRVLLIDDVLTSGATVNACAHMIRSAGAKSVDVLVAARAFRI